MQAIFKMQDGSFIPLANGLPPGYEGILLEGSLTNYHQTASELIIQQYFERQHFAIQLGIFKFLRLVRSIFQPPPFATGILFALKSELKSGIQGTGSFTLREGQFSFLRFPNENLLTEFKAEKEYQFLHISYSDQVTAQTLPLFTDLPSLFNKMKAEKSSSVFSSPRNAGSKIPGLIQDLLHTPFTQDANEMYFENRVRECLLLLLLESSKTEESGIYLSQTERDRLNTFAAKLRDDPQGKYPIPKIARELGMNQMKLKSGFKQMFGKSIFEYHTEQRMKVAHRLLEESGLPTKVIANMVGYDLASSLITRFREYYHYPPSRIQKKF